MQDKYIIVERPPSPEEFNRLRRAVGWVEVDTDVAREGLGGSLYAVCVVHESEVIGCGRVVGDGGMYYYIQDVMIYPEYGEEGIGELIMDALMIYLKKRAAISGVTISLMTVTGRIGLYERYGFKRDPGCGPGLTLTDISDSDDIDINNGTQ